MLKMLTKFKDVLGSIMTGKGWLIFPFLGYSTFLAHAKSEDAGLLNTAIEFLSPVFSAEAWKGMAMMGGDALDIIIPGAKFAAEGAGVLLSSVFGDAASGAVTEVASAVNSYTPFSPAYADEWLLAHP